MKLADKVKNRLLKHLFSQNRNDLILPNLYYKSLDFECDVFMMKPSGYTTEYEIKISKADFKNDFKKKQCKWSENSPLKHELIASGQRTNYFYFVIPKEFMEDQDVYYLIPPEYGIVTFELSKKNDDVILSYLRPPKKLHKNKISDEEKQRLFFTLWSKYFNLYWKYQRNIAIDTNILKNNNEKLTKEKTEWTHKNIKLRDQRDFLLEFIQKNIPEFSLTDHGNDYIIFYHKDEKLRF